MDGYQEDIKIVFKKNAKNVFKNIKELLIGIILSLVVFYFIYKIDNEFNLLIGILLIYFSLVIIPALYLFFEYFFLDKNTIIKIENNIIQINNEKINKHDIIKILILAAPNKLQGKNFQLFPIESFSCMIIKTKTKYFFISSLIDFEFKLIEKSIDFKNIEKQSSIFPSILIHRKFYFKNA